MNSWEYIISKVKRAEFNVLFLATIFTLLSLAAQFLVTHRNLVFFVVKDLPDVTLTILEIQATITTLTLSILALLSGNLSDSYMGVSVSKFYLEIRCFFLSLNKVIVLEFILLSLNIGCQLFELYNVIIGMFFVSLLIILRAILNIYPVFKGKNNSHNEIKLYVTNKLKDINVYHEKMDLFIKDWKLIISQQSEEEFKEYYSIFKEYVYKTLELEKNTQNANSASETIVLYLLNHESVLCKKRGIEFTTEFYIDMYSWFHHNQDDAKRISNPFQLFSRISHKYRETIWSLNSDVVEKVLEWGSFSKAAIYIASYDRFSNKEDALKEITEIHNFAKFLGLYITRQKNRANIVSNKFWSDLIKDRYVSDFRLPKFRENLAINRFNICYGYLLNNQAALVRNAIFTNELSLKYKINNPEYVLQIMLIHCYMFYLGFIESTDCVDEHIQLQIRNILKEKRVIDSINNFYFLLAMDNTLLSGETESKMEKILEEYELFPKSTPSKMMIISSVVRDYFVYVLLFMHKRNRDKSRLKDLINEQTYYTYLYESNSEKLRRNLYTINCMFDSNKENNPDTVNDIDNMRSVFFPVLKEKYKKHLLENSENIEKQFNAKKIRKRFETIIKSEINKNIISLSKECDSKQFTSKKQNEIKICSFNCLTEQLCNCDFNIYVDEILTNFLEILINFLTEDFHIEKYNRDAEFNNDISFRKFLEKNKYNTLIGSGSIFCCKDYISFMEHSDFLNRQNLITFGASDSGIAMKEGALFVNLEAVNVELCSVDRNKIKHEKDKETDLIRYEPISGISLDFEEKEYELYIKNTLKEVNISLDMTIGISNENDSLCIIQRSVT